MEDLSFAFFLWVALIAGHAVLVICFSACFFASFMRFSWWVVCILVFFLLIFLWFCVVGSCVDFWLALFVSFLLSSGCSICLCLCGRVVTVLFFGFILIVFFFWGG